MPDSPSLNSPATTQQLEDVATSFPDPEMFTGVRKSSNGFMDSLLATVGDVSPISQLLLFMYQILSQWFGIDPSMALTAAGIIWGLTKLLKQGYLFVAGIVESHFTCSIHILEDDQIYDYVMKFMSQHPHVVSSRQLMAETAYQGPWDDDDGEQGEIPDLYWTKEGNYDYSRNPYHNFSRQAIQSTPLYTPALGHTSFWYGGRRFTFSRLKETFTDANGWGPMKDAESICVSCYGRSTKPIQKLLAATKALYCAGISQKTTIYRPRPKDLQRDHGLWQQVAHRPIRPIKTVILSYKKKNSVLADMNEYLHPTASFWYASRGIPLRRGYLFHGPPGTGKTSFAFALAGVFGIEIYVISLQDGCILEQDLTALFTKLPRRCIVLLEDIDSAGLRRDTEMSQDNRNKPARPDTVSNKDNYEGNDKEARETLLSGNDSSSGDEDREARRERQHSSQGKRRRGSENGVSLSGLLNAIDGVASHEGRVLIMTTNKRESLDAALLRPGRVDMQVQFPYASRSQIRELFQNMYETPQTDSFEHSESGSKVSAEKLSIHPCTVPAEEDHEPNVDADEMRKIAAQFATCIPEDNFSPAEIQGFLLGRKKSPRRALEEVSAWVKASSRQKKANSTAARKAGVVNETKRMLRSRGQA